MGGTVSFPTPKISSERTFVITGGNTGIGYETSKAIAEMGGRVVIACRSEERASQAIERMQNEHRESMEKKQCHKSGDSLNTGEDEVEGMEQDSKTDRLQVEFMALDLSSLQSTMDFISAYKQKGYPLHVLICNAGIANARQAYTVDGFESQFQVMQMYALQRRLEGSGIVVTSLHPGQVSTEIHRNFEDSYIWWTYHKVVKGMGILRDPIDGAATSINCAVNPELAGVGGVYFSDCEPDVTSAQAQDVKAQEELWEYSVKCLKEYLSEEMQVEFSQKIEGNSEQEI